MIKRKNHICDVCGTRRHRVVQGTNQVLYREIKAASAKVSNKYDEYDCILAIEYIVI